MKADTRFLIVGLGLMGGSYAMGLSNQGYTVAAIDRDPEAIQWALEHQLISQGACQGEEAEELIREADCIVMALYPKDILPWLLQHRPVFKPGALFTDLAGVKTCFVSQAQAILAPSNEFIACHPMAGRETSGVQNASVKIFSGANFIITPTEANSEKAIAFARQLADTLGFAPPILLTPEQHDSMIGYVSQLTHAIAVCLMNANGNPLLPKVTGDSFRDLTRIADINAELWSELFLANAPALTKEIDEFTACLQQLKGYVAQGDKEGLKEMFAISSQRRRQFNKI